MKQKKILTLLAAVFFACSPLFTLPAHAAGCPNCGGSLSSGGSSATCTEEGVSLTVCSGCGAVYEKIVGPLGHKYKVSSDATCTKAGTVTHTCSRCGDSYVEKTGPLGHNFKKTTEDATCTEDGLELLNCTRCGAKQETVLPALGHDYETSSVAPTCTQDGSSSKLCRTCGDTVTEVLPAVGHKYEVQETLPTCTTDGVLTRTCSVCGESDSVVTPAAGHHFGEWAVVASPTLFQEGLEERSCNECGIVEANPLPQKTLRQSPGAIAAITAAAIALASGIGFAVRRAVLASAAATAAAASLPYITLVMKSLLVYTKEDKTNKAFLEQLGKRPYLDIKTVPYGDETALREMAEKEKPDLILLSADEPALLNHLTEEITAIYKDADFSVIDELGTNGPSLKAMQEADRIMSYAAGTDSDEKKIVKLILPLYKPDRNASNWAENATLITDALGLPIISLLLNAYVVGGDVVEVVKNKGMGVMDAADIVNDAAALLGLDMLSNIAEVLRVGSDQHQRLADNKERKEKESPVE